MIRKIQHVCFQVDDVAESLARVAGEGVRLVDETPRAGMGGMRIGFLDPESTFGALTEFAQEGDAEP